MPVCRQVLEWVLMTEQQVGIVCAMDMRYCAIN